MTKDDLVNKLGAINPDVCLNKYMRTIDEYSTTDDLSYIYSEDCLLIGLGIYSSYMVAEDGLGFYSAFMVADKVVITTKKAGHDEQYVWELDANENGASFTVATRDTSGGGDTLDRGTKVTLHLKEGHLEYLEERKLQELVKKYSKYICPYPISISILDKNKNLIEKQIVDDDDKKKEEEQWELLKERYECIRELFVKFMADNVKNLNFVISDRIFDLPWNLSVDDTSTLEISPRHREMEEIMEAFVANPNDKQLKYKILLRFEFCVHIFREYDERHGTSFYENAVKTISIGNYLEVSKEDEEEEEDEEDEWD